MARMSGFDIIEAAGNGYVTVWRERDWLLRLAAPVLFVKILCMGAVAILGIEENFISQAIVMLPAFFIEGWLAVHLVRLIVLGERWIDRPDPREVHAGMLVFVLMKFALSGLAALALAPGTEDLAAAREREPGMFPVLSAIVIFAAMIWSFRYLWLYIPAAVGMNLRAFLRNLGGFSASFHIIGAWLICFVPFILALGIVSGLILPPAQTPGPLSLPATALLLAVQSALDTATTLVTTAAITYGLVDLTRRKEKP